MGLFDFFRKRKERSIEKEFEAIEKELGQTPSQKSPGHEALDRCEQMIRVAQEMEEEKEEYRIVTAYLNDVELLQNLPDKEKKQLKETADNVNALISRREKYLNRKKKISDSDYAMMENEERTLPDIIRRFKGNEAYRDALERDIRYLEGEKTQWDMLGDDYKGSVKRNGVLVILLLITVILGSIAVIFLPYSIRQTVVKIWIPVCAVLAILAAFLYLKSLSDKREIKQAFVNQNRAIELLNKAKLKYVHTKNAIDYVCEKYHVKNAVELERMYENYQEAARERAKYAENNEDLNYFSDKLLKLLRQYRLYDDRFWLSRPNALSDPKEMVEVKHDLILRRQKLRDELRLHQDEIVEEKKKVYAILERNPDGAAEIRKLLAQIDTMTGLREDSFEG